MEGNMKILNKVTVFILGISQVVFANTKITIDLSQIQKLKSDFKLEKSLAQQLADRQLIKIEKSSAATNCIGTLSD